MAFQGIDLKDFKLVFLSAILHLSSIKLTITRTLNHLIVFFKQIQVVFNLSTS